MKNITVLIFFHLPLMMTGKGVQEGTNTCSSHSQIDDDYAETPVETIFEMFQLFHGDTIKQTYTEWISQRSTFQIPSKIVNSKIITFTKFISYEDIIPISNLHKVDCTFQSYLSINFKNEPKITNIEGNVEFLLAENFSSCIIFFDFRLSRTVHNLNTQYHEESPKNPIDFVFMDYTRLENMQLKSENDSCQLESEKTELKKDIQYAMNKTTKEMLKLVAVPVFQSILNKCLYSRLNKNGKNYPRINLDPNTNEFPRDFYYDGLAIKGLENFKRLQISYARDTTLFTLSISDVILFWDTSHTETERFYSNGQKRPDFKANFAQIIANMRTPIDYRKVNLQNIAESSDYNYSGFEYRHKLGMMDSPNDSISIRIPSFIRIPKYNRVQQLVIERADVSGIKNLPEHIIKILRIEYPHEVDDNLRETLTILIMVGIEQTFQKIRYNGTAGFTNSIHKLLRLFDKNPFENFIDDLYKMSPLDNSTIIFPKIEMEEYPRLENITCKADDGTSRIGTISHKNMKGQAYFTRYVKNTDIYRLRFRDFSDVFLSQMNIAITPSTYANRANEITVQRDDFNVMEAMILLDTPLAREDRVSVGKQIFENFVQMISAGISNAVNTAFLPLFDACQGLLHGVNELGSNHFYNSHRYFAFIRGRWANSTDPSLRQSIDVVIDGTWNFQDFKIEHVNETFIFGGLRMENVTGSMKLWNGIDESVVLNYSASYLTLTINHAHADTEVNVPQLLYLVVATAPKSSFILNPIEVTKKFETIVGDFIKQTIS